MGRAFNEADDGSVTITLAFTGDEAKALKECLGSDVGQVLRDALGEFVDARGGSWASAEGYVAKRYPTQSTEWRARKVRDVNKRMALALALRAVDVTIFDGCKP
jgi:hypothetical protein